MPVTTASIKQERLKIINRCEAMLDRLDAEDRPMTASEEDLYEADMAEIKALNAKLDEGQRPTVRVQPSAHISNRPVFPDENMPRIVLAHSGKLKAFRNSARGVAAAHETGRFFAATFLRHQPSMNWCDNHGVRYDVMAALSGGVNTSGGALVPDVLSKTIIELMDTYGSFRANAGGLLMSSDSETVPRRTGGLVASYVGEGVAGDESDASWDNVTFVAKKLIVLTRMSSEVSEDAIINLGDKMAQEIAYAFALKEDTVGYTGDGTAASGGHTGVLVKALQPAYSKAKVAAASGHDKLDEIDADDLLRLMAAIPDYAKAGAAWYCSPTALALVFNAILIAGGGNSIQNLANAVEPTFLGYPIVVTPVMADDASATYNGAVMIGFGNLAQAATIGTRREVRVQMTDQRYWSEDQIGIKGTMRHSIVVHDLGSTTVKSPFAVLVGTT
ncbi:MAG: phage major capsid protein, HK97 family [Candidatus Nitrotoga sp. SPKER]|nr:MAG: phage major capsid protein, HK97 family [Candidatus Nitrotoga sp. SPKER]